MTTLIPVSRSISDTVTLVQVNDHQISTDDTTWHVFKTETDAQSMSLWTRIQRIMKDVFGYSSNSTEHSTGVAIPDKYNA